MAAPIIVSKRQQPGLQTLPQLSQGERLMQAEIAGSRRVAAAEIGGIQRESAAEIGVGRAIAGEAMRASEPQVRFAAQVDRQATNLATMIMDAQSETRSVAARRTWSEETEKARLAERDNPDWQGGPQRFREKLTEIESGIVKGLSSAEARSFQLATTTSRASMLREIEQNSHSRMAGQAQADATVTARGLVQQAGRAPSAVERDALLQQADVEWDRLATRGLITPLAADQQKQSGRKQLDQASFATGLQKDPAATLKAMQTQDRTLFPTFGPDEFAQGAARAQATYDSLAGKRAKDSLDRGEISAVATYVRAPTDGMVRTVVRGALAKGESSYNPNAESHAGAAGISQIVPDTARRLAPKVGISLAGMDDEQVKAWLKANPGKSLEMADVEIGTYWRKSGSLAAAFAAYQAGPGAADKWVAAATEKFGPGFTHEQFISVIPAGVTDAKPGKPGKTTRAYVADMLKAAGADLARGGVSERAAYTISDGIEAHARAEQTQRRQDLSKIVSIQDDDRSTMIGQLKSGLAVDPQQVAAIKAPLEAGAALGDATAIKELRRVNEAVAVHTIAQDWYRASPQQLEAQVAELQAVAARTPLSPPQARMLETLQGVATEVDKQTRENPQGLLERRTGERAPAIPVGEAPSLIGEALQARAPRYAEAQRIYGIEADKWLQPQEAQALKQRWAQAQEPERADLLRAFHSGTGGGKGYDALVEQLGVDKLSATAGRIGAADPEVGRSILRGAALLKQKGVDDGKASELREALKSTLGGSLYPPEIQGELVNAALARYVDLRGGAGTLFDASDRRGLQSAIEDVAGRIATVNGGKVPAPRGVSPGRLESAWAAATAADLTGPQLGREGQLLPAGTLVGRGGQALDPDFVKAHGQLRPAGLADGRYFVVLPGAGRDQSVRDGAGRQIILDLNPVVKRLQSVFPAEADMRMLPEPAARPDGVVPLDPFSAPRLVGKPGLFP